MKNLIVCFDGTWNDENNKDGGIPAPTNVRRLFRSLSHTPQKQLTRYQAGVGTEGIIDKLAGGAFGIGISEDIMDCYYWISKNYHKGDKIFLFGFSRGAFCARSLAGMIAIFGILNALKENQDQLINQIEQLYRHGYRKKLTEVNIKEKFPHLNFFEESKSIEFIGVWDTVGALGVPDDKAIANLFDNPEKYQFHDVEINPNIKNARHAIAIDEMRSNFTPTLWTDKNDNVLNNEKVKQVWFPGVHSDVGGGYKENGLSNCALKWMIDEANICTNNSIIFAEGFVDKLALKVDPLDIMHDSHSGIMKALRPRPRAVPNISDGAIVSSYAKMRNLDPSHVQAPYRPSSQFINGMIEKDIYAKHPWYWTGIFLEKGKKYNFSASGTWCDASISCGPEGTKDGRFHTGEIFHIIGSIIEKLERILKKATKNEKLKFSQTRRIERDDAPWFCLMGCVANEVKQNIDGSPENHEFFPIGSSKKDYTPEKSGYLYCFANDAWGFYSNNRNYVTLKITEA